MSMFAASQILLLGPLLAKSKGRLFADFRADAGPTLPQGMPYSNIDWLDTAGQAGSLGLCPLHAIVAPPFLIGPT